jgi:hypothetical protein
MSEAKLPEELIREILNIHLSISEYDFCQFPDNGCPLWMMRASKPSCAAVTSDLLLVSKRWLRVGTPLLYSSVKLWEPKHTKAVAKLVQTNSAIGKAIRMLRVEGGMGRDLYTIVKHAPNIETLYISMHIGLSEGITGLRKSLPVISPITVYIHSSDHLKSNKVIDEACKLVRLALTQSWTKMASFLCIPNVLLC